MGEAGLMSDNPLTDFVPGDMSNDIYDKVDIHKHIDAIVLISESGKPMRERS